MLRTRALLALALLAAPALAGCVTDRAPRGSLVVQLAVADVPDGLAALEASPRQLLVHTATYGEEHTPIHATIDLLALARTGATADFYNGTSAAADYERLEVRLDTSARESSGERVDVDAPVRSLELRKPFSVREGESTRVVVALRVVPAGDGYALRLDADASGPR